MKPKGLNRVDSYYICIENESEIEIKKWNDSKCNYT